jgi:hypothetical protein
MPAAEHTIKCSCIVVGAEAVRLILDGKNLSFDEVGGAWTKDFEVKFRENGFFVCKMLS